MIRLDAFGQAVSEFLKVAWSATPSLQSLQVVFNRENFQALFNRAVGACSSLISSPPKLSNHIQNPRVVVITSVTVVVLFVVNKVRGSVTRSDTVVVMDKRLGFKDLMQAYGPILKEDASHLTPEAFIAKHGEDALKILDDPTRRLICPEPVVEEGSEPSQQETMGVLANAQALHLK